MAFVPYSKGAVANGTTDYPFIYAQDIVQAVHEQGLVSPFGSQELTDILELVKGGSKETPNPQYSRWEEGRNHPKIKASNAGAGAAGGSVTFTVHPDASTAVTYNPDPMIATGYTKTSYVPTVGQTIMMSPNSTASYTDMVHALVVSVTGNQFVATPLDGFTIPAQTNAEIIVYGIAMGEATGYPLSSDSDVTEYKNNIQIFAQEYQLSDLAKNLKTWIALNGQDEGGWGIRGEKNTFIRMKNYINLTMLIGKKISNVPLANSFTEKQVITTNGLFQEVTDFGNTLKYGATANVFDLDDFREAAAILDLQRGSKQNLVAVGHSLRSGMNKAITADTKILNGGISYGMFNWDQEKKIAFDIDSIRVDGHTFHIKTLDSLSDVQTLGAVNMPFSREGIIIPMDEVRGGNNTSVPSIRKRFLKDMEFGTYMHDYSKGDSGQRKTGMRYHAYQGLECNSLTPFIRLANQAP